MKKDLRDEIALIILPELMKKNGYVVSSIWFRISKFLGISSVVKRAVVKRGERNIYWNYQDMSKAAYEFADIFLEHKNKTK